MSKPIDLLGHKNISPGNLIKKLDKRSKNWKERSMKNQREKRSLQIQVRDLKRSAIKYKKKYKEVEAKQILLEQYSSSNNIVIEQGGSNSVVGSTYNSWQISTSIEWYLNSSTSFRAIGKNWEVLSGYLDISKIPSYSVVRQLVLRVGLYKLQQPLEQSNDWVYIMDYSIQMGSESCLLILGFRMSAWRNSSDQNLNFSQLQVIDLSITTSATGEHVHARLEAAMSRTGVPLQIVSDSGSNLLRGQRLWKDAHQELLSEVISSYDVSHLVGCELKKFLSENEQWIGLTQELGRIQKRTQQSAIGFIAPRTLRSTARYMNLYDYADYLDRWLAYQTRGDFSLLAQTWQIASSSSSSSSMEILSDTQIKEVQQIKAPSQAIALQQLAELKLPLNMDCLDLVHDGEQVYKKYFSHLLEHLPFICVLITLVKYISQLQKELKTDGLSKALIDKWVDYEVALPTDLLEKFWQPLMKRLKEQATLLPDTNTYLATSDIIESLFGWYKSKDASHWLKGMTPLVLGMSARTGSTDAHTIQQALETIKIEDVQNWFATQRAGPSFLAKRKQALKTTKELPKKKPQVVQKIITPPDKIIQMNPNPKQLKTG